MLCSAILLAFASLGVFDHIFDPAPDSVSSVPDFPDFEPSGISAEPAARQSSITSLPDAQIATRESPVEQGLRVYIDPATGRMGPPPPEALPAAAAIPANHPLSTSGEGLIETPGQTRGGGVIVNLQGRFRSTVVTSVEPGGTVVTRCLGTASPGHSDDCPQCPPQPSNTPNNP
jgi:hypothetical protein